MTFTRENMLILALIETW